MANSHPYISGAGNVTAIISQLRKNFPATVNSETVKKYGLASNNESYVVNILVFLGLIDEEGKRTDAGHSVMSTHNEEDFQKAFGELVKKAYSDLFETFGEADGWKQGRDSLVTYFRRTDKTSDIIGKRQASVFLALAALSGYGEVPAEAVKSKAAVNKAKPAVAKVAKKKVETVIQEPAQKNSYGNGSLKRDMALTVRIEINLPAGGTQETYDAIFKSIKANLIDE